MTYSNAPRFECVIGTFLLISGTISTADPFISAALGEFNVAPGGAPPFCPGCDAPLASQIEKPSKFSYVGVW